MQKQLYFNYIQKYSN